MELARLMGGNYPFKANIPVYDAATLAYGELVMRHATWHSNDEKYYISAYVATSATEAEDTVGIIDACSVNASENKDNRNVYRIGVHSAAWGVLPDGVAVDGWNFLPAIVNPDATYFAEYDQTDAINQTGAVAASTAWAVTNLEDDIEGAWLFTTRQASSTATYPGKLRYGTASAAGTLTVGVAVTVDTLTDIVKVLPIGHRLVALNAEATGLTTTAAAASTIYLEIRENYVQWQGSPEMEMRKWLHDGLDGLGGLRCRGEIIQLKHAYRQVVV